MFSSGIAPPSFIYPALTERPAGRSAETSASDSTTPATTTTGTTPPGQVAGAGSRPRETRADQAQILQEHLEIAELAARDREVRAHEQAHASVGGALAGAPSYSYTRGPDGRRYVTGGEVSIDTSAVAGNPQATLRKMEQVQRAALAPAEPSAQDRSVAAQAQAAAAQARAELVRLNGADDPVRKDPESEKKAAALDVYRSVAEDTEGTSTLVDLTA